MRLLLLLLLPSWATAQPVEVRSLKDAYSLALAASESVAVSEASVKQARALYRRAFGSNLPLLSFVHTTSAEDGSGTDNVGVLRLSQSGLNGYRELANLRVSKAGLSQREAERRRAEQLLLQDVSGAYFGLLQAQENMKASRQLKEFAEGRLKELRDRVRVGRSREADAIAQQSQIAVLESQLEESARQAAARTDLLLYLTRAAAAAPQPGDDALAVEPRPLEDYLARAEHRPDVATARAAADVAEAAVRLTRADTLPQIGFVADWRLYQPSSQTADWDAAVSVGVPLWAWGAQSANVKAAKAGREAQRIALSSARRAAELEIRDAHRDYLSARRQLEVQSRAVELARRDYQLQIQDEGRGLVTAIEVLQSLERLNQARLAHSNALLTTQLTAIDLELAAGAAPKDMELR